MKTKYDYFLETISAHASDACLIWPFAARNKDHGVVSVNGDVRYVRQLAYEYAYGAIPPQWRTKQTCGNHRCYNKLHVTAIQPPLEYFSETVKKLGDRKGPCEVWPYACFGSAYGNIVVNGRNESVSRLAYAAIKGPIPKGLDVCHSCDNPPCFRPAHLFTGTREANMLDCATKGRDNRGKKGRKGELSGSAKLTEKDVLKLYAMQAKGLPTKAMLNMFPAIGRSGLSHILNGRSWLHLWPKRRLHSRRSI